MDKKIKDAVDGVLARVCEIRHRIHQNPELACEEYETAKLVRDELAATSVVLRPPFLETDVVGLLTGEQGPGVNVTLRADMDALPLQEKTDLPYRSKRDGFMHACGHDGHTAMLLGAACVLDQLKDQFAGSVRFVFQPGEEVVAAGRDLVAAGALDDPEPVAVLALHGAAGTPVGMLKSRGGELMAAAAFFKIAVHGEGGHGSMPHAAINPILSAARIVTALQTITANEMDPFEPAVVTVCRLDGGLNGNVIPDTVEVEGTTRYFSIEQGARIWAAIERIAMGTCRAMGTTCELSLKETYIPTINDDNVVKMARGVIFDVLGEESWRSMKRPSMGSEDFSFYTAKYPGAMLELGLGEASVPLHNPRFDFNDAALRNGIVFMVSATLKVLAKQGV